ncbi:MAG: hypothetical protein UY52_C0040G0004 [Parcubacteria group bacterium GW2011_GWC2_49_9]|nr:MAG: hypothetical protein UY52_C0040G0004 [Parcubacteria group bacterium GW2011_GWC2_49_9]
MKGRLTIHFFSAILLGTQTLSMAQAKSQTNQNVYNLVVTGLVLAIIILGASSLMTGL